MCVRLLTFRSCIRDLALDSREYRGSGSDLGFCRAHGVKPSGLEECRFHYISTVHG